MKELTTAKHAAREAGKLLLSYFGNLKDIQFKSGRRDPVSEADKASEALIAGIIKSAFPTHGFLAEEKTAWKGDGGRWIVDPLDGTVNYSHGFPCFCVSIAYERDGEVLVGVVHDPVRREMFYAVKGKGAFLNGKRLNVSKTPKLANSFIVTGFPYDLDKRADMYTSAVRQDDDCKPGDTQARLCRARPVLHCGGAVRRLLGIRAEALGHRCGYAHRHGGWGKGHHTRRRAFSFHGFRRDTG